MKNKYILLYQATGICELNMPLLKKKWQSNLAIYFYPNENKYTFAVNGKRNYSMFQISEQSARDLIAIHGLLEGEFSENLYSFKRKEDIENELKEIELKINHTKFSLQLLNQQKAILKNTLNE
jgi:hypothetical protein